MKFRIWYEVFTEVKIKVVKAPDMCDVIRKIKLVHPSAKLGIIETLQEETKDGIMSEVRGKA